MKTLTTWSVLFFIFGYSLVVCSELPSPENVTLDTLNTNYVLKWNWDEDNIKRITFTTQYLPKFKITKPKHKQNWKSACGVTFKHICDFTAVQLHYYGVWLLRVRAQSGKLVSNWVQIEFCPDRDAQLGPPSRVDVTPVNGHLQVSITDPMTNTNISMRELLPNLSYLTQYWEHLSQTQKPKSLLHQSNLVILPELASWTWYCIRVQSHETFYNKTSVFSPTYCLQTDGPVPSWQIFLYFLLSLVLCFLFVVALGYGFYKLFTVVKNTLYPAVPLPAHIHQYLCISTSSDMPHLLTTELEVEHCCDRLDVISKPAVTDIILEIHTSTEDSGLGPEHSNAPHTRHSSGDSGVYSTVEDSGSDKSAPQNWVQEVKLQTVNRGILTREPGDKEAGQEQDLCITETILT
ncbi:interferon alpha/beta receptor 1b-like [Electrophorus electricus]|uniref:Fibronectin type-III domain-containing protein n=1 Tax=Electrophorus electricus TaxID=8005 RepID=A0A4W4DV00_ELEEL|nr:interferon alpha/beta receptor 1b-like [Electrophorus electricus]